MNEEKYGLLPAMDWLDINKLVIDTSYQRTTTSKRSKNNIVKITENFAWSRLVKQHVMLLGGSPIRFI